MKKYLLHISVFIALLFHISGAIGIMYSNQRETFVSITPYLLLLMFGLLLLNQPGINLKFVLFFIISTVTGFAAEVIGVNTGKLFGNYTYGNYLGPKPFETPLLIGLNWFVIIFCSATIVNRFTQKLLIRYESDGLTMSKSYNLLSAIIDGALLAVLFDYVMEPVAVKLGFWKWQNNDIPFYNYICWFIISCLLMYIYKLLNLNRHNRFAIHLFAIQLLFFLFLRVFL